MTGCPRSAGVPEPLPPEVSLAELQAQYNAAVGTVKLHLPGTAADADSRTDTGAVETEILRLPPRDADKLNPLLSSVF